MPLRYKSPMRPLRPAARWVDGGPIDLESLRGRAVLAHFWSLSSEESRRQMHRVEHWIDRYGSQLQIIRVHTPLEVEDMDHDRVIAAIAELGLTGPAALDGDDGALADLYDVRDVPAYFLFDADLRLRNQRAGRGAADAMEKILARVFPGVGPRPAQTRVSSHDSSAHGV